LGISEEARIKSLMKIQVASFFVREFEHVGFVFKKLSINTEERRKP